MPCDYSKMQCYVPFDMLVTTHSHSDKNQTVHTIKVGLYYIVPTLLNCAVSIHTCGKYDLIRPQIFCSIPWYLIYLFNLLL